MSTPAEEPDLHLVKETKARPTLLHTAVSAPAVAAPVAPPARSYKGLFLFFATALSAAFLAAGAEYWFRHDYTFPGRPVSVLKPIRQALPTPPSPSLEVAPESVHVSAIVLGTVPLAVVNGKQVAEGDWLEVRMNDRVAALHVVKIEDGAVQFGYGGRTISARLNVTNSAKPAP